MKKFKDPRLVKETHYPTKKARKCKHEWRPYAAPTIKYDWSICEKCGTKEKRYFSDTYKGWLVNLKMEKK